MFKKYGFTTQAFFAGDENLRGPLYEGLPTLEKQRYYSPLASILELQNMGVKFDVRGVPSDQPANIDDLIRSAEKKLAEKK